MICETISFSSFNYFDLDNANVDLDAKKSEDAAVKIQASYRGFAARKEVEAMKNSKSDEAANQGESTVMFQQSMPEKPFCP